MVPLSVFVDQNLGVRDFRVLGVLFCHAGRERLAWPTREVISQMTGIAVADVSRTTSKLAALGYLSKTRGRGKGAEYSLREVCEKNTSQAHEVCEKNTSEVCEKNTSQAHEVCEKNTSEVCENSTSSPSTPILLKRPMKRPRGREENTEAVASPIPARQDDAPPADQPADPKPAGQDSGKARTKKKTISKFVPPDTISPQTWAHFEEHRRRINHPMTDYARQLIVKHLDKLHEQTGDSRNDLLDFAVLSGWRKPWPIRDGGNGNERTKGNGNGARREGNMERYDREHRAYFDRAIADEERELAGRTFDAESPDN